MYGKVDAIQIVMTLQNLINIRFWVFNSQKLDTLSRRAPTHQTFQCESHNFYGTNMISQRQIFTLIAAASSAGAFLQHPSASLRHAASSSSLIVEPFGDGRADTSLGVGIRSPYWHVFNRVEAPAKKGVGQVIDRDYTVASVLICVGLWLGMFGPSAYTQHHSRVACALRSISRNFKLGLL